MIAQIYVTPIGIRQEAVLVFFSVPKLIQLATKMPRVINNWYVLLLCQKRIRVIRSRIMPT